MRKTVYWLSLVMIFTIPWEGAFHLPGFGTAATIMGLIVTALWIALVAMTGQMRLRSETCCGRPSTSS